MATQLGKAERVRRALAGEQVDHPPIGFWAHNFAMENSAEDLAEETVRRFRRHDWDFIKIQSRASAFAEDWGNRYRRSGERAVPPALLEWPIHRVSDLRALRPLNPISCVLGEQIAALQLIRREVGPDVPILQTIFAPAMVLSYLVGHSARGVLELLRGYPTQTVVALAMIRDTLAEYARACIESGGDGVFFAVKAAATGQMTREEYARFGLPFDWPVLDAARGGWLNTLHLCGPNLYFEVANDLPAPLLNWALEPGNPTLKEGRELTRRTVAGGVSAKPRIREMTPEQVQAEVYAALDDTGGVGVVIAPGCSISPDTPEENLDAAREAVETWKRRT